MQLANQALIRQAIRDVLLEECLLQEGPHDPGRLKAIFMAGAPGSGKGTAIRAIFGDVGSFTSQGLKIVNADTLFEQLMKAHNLSMSPPSTASEEELKQWRSDTSKLQQRALGKVTGGSPGISAQRLGLDPAKYGVKPKKQSGPMTQLERYIEGRLGLLIDGTATNYNRIIREKQLLEDLGYETMMIAVSIPLERAIQQNVDRGKQGGRQVHLKSLESQWTKLQDNMPKYEAQFDNFVVVDDDNPATAASSTVNQFLS
jgi:predicted ABC-type ATPase